MKKELNAPFFINKPNRNEINNYYLKLLESKP
jgi:hypothetical protein